MKPSRADTPEQKKEVTERLYQVWLRDPSLRLGQLISLAIPNGGDPFYLEDFELVSRLEKRTALPSKRVGKD
jgi:hypothetical protein